MGVPDFTGRRSHLLTLLTCALLFCLILLPYRSGTANAASAGHISGRLLNGSHHNTPVANQSVTLQMAQGNNSRDLLSLTTDAQGNYTFSGLVSDSSTRYAVYTLYQGAQYVTDLIDLSKNPDQQVNLTVYDATTSTTNLAVVQASILLDKPDAQTGLLSISEDFVFENLGNTTYVGTIDTSHGKPDALLFSLPPAARFLSLGTGFNGYNVVQVNTGFASNAAVPPGTSEFSFSFQVPYSGSGYQFTYKTLYPTVELSLLTPTTLLTSAQGLVSKGPRNTQSGTYEMFQAQALRANSAVEAQLAGLPVPVKATIQQNSLSSNWLWLVVFLFVLLLLVGSTGYIYRARSHQAASNKGGQRKGKKTGPTKAVPVATTEEGLLREILELDQAYEAGKLKKNAYQSQRSRLKAHLRSLIDERRLNKTTIGGKGEK